MDGGFGPGPFLMALGVSNCRVGRVLQRCLLMKPSTDWKGVRWESVKGVANNDFTRVVALIPIAGYLILFNDEIAGMASSMP